MNFVESIDMLGIPAKEIPCIKGKGGPTAETTGAVGVMYLDTDADEVYICIAVSSTAFTWEPLTKKIQSQVDALSAEVAALNPLKFTAISVSPSVCEKGQTIEEVTVRWSLNKEAVSQTVNGEEVDASARSHPLSDLSITAKYTVTVTATDARGKIAADDASVYFYNGVYYGVVEDGADLTSAAVLSLTRKLQGSRALTFTANAGAVQRIAYALPVNGYGTPAFKDVETGFQADFYLADTIAFKNASGYEENYNVWLSTNLGLGSRTIAVS